MSSELIASYYSAFNARDYAAMLALLSDDVIHDVNQGGHEIGRAAFAAFLARMDQSYREQLVDLVIMGDPSETRFAAEFTVVGEYLRADSGLALQGGKIARVTTYYNLQDWLAQVSGAA
jgi:steroid delta-isomerase-like uncharacterized protein